MLKGKERLSWVDNLKALAVFGMIFLHSSFPLLEKFDKSPHIYRNWWIGNIYDSSVRFCVPVFLMLTGALLLGSDISLGNFLKKRFIRIFLPFLFWTIIYLLCLYDYSHVHTPIEIWQWAYPQLENGVYYHMWYVYMIVGVYLFIPILNKWIRNSTEKEILYFLFIWLFIIIRQLPFVPKIGSQIDLSYFSRYIGYLVLGYYLSTKQFKTTHIVKIAAGLFITGVPS